MSNYESDGRLRRSGRDSIPPNSEAGYTLSSDQAAAVFEHAPVPLVVIDSRALSYVQLNDAARRYCGLTSPASVADLIGRPLLSSPTPVTGAGQDLLVSILRHLADSPVNNTGLFVCSESGPDGAARVTEVRLTPNGGDTSLLVGSLEDVTERLKAAEEIERFRYIGKHGPVAIAVYDTALRYVYVSDQYLRDYRIGDRDVIGLRNIDVFPDKSGKWDEDYSRCLQGAVVWKADDQFVYSDGSVGHNRWECRPWHHSDGSIGGIITYSEVITDRVRAEEELRISEERFRQVAETAGEFIWEIGIDGIYTYASPVIEKLLGYTPDEVVGKMRFTDMFAPEVREALTAAAHDAMTRNVKLRAFPHLNARKDGTVVIMETSAVPVLDPHGQLVGYRGVDTDVSQRQQSEELRVQKEAAEAASSAKSRFLAHMSHEIRTPMNAILGFAQLLQRDPAVTAKQKRSLEAMNRSAEHLLSVINDILEMAKLEAVSATLNSEAFDLHRLLSDLEMVFRVRTEAKRLRFTIERIGDVPRYVETDEGKLRQVLINLIGNAVKFTEKGSITVRLEADRSLGDDPRLLVQVEDTGQGIADDESSRLFLPFEQTQSGRMTGSGSGLGLAISRGLVRLMGGDIRYRQHADGGSLFEFYIVFRDATPAAVARQSLADIVATLQRGSRECRMLIACADPDTRDRLGSLVAPAGFELAFAATGESAVREFSAWRPALILIAGNLPDMDANEAVRRIRAGVGGKEVAVLVVGGSSDAGMSASFRADIDGCLCDVQDETELLDGIASALSARRNGYVSARAERQPGRHEPLEYGAAKGVDPDLRAEIEAAVREADYDRVHELIDRVDSQNSAVAEGLRRLAENYDSRELLALLRNGETA